MYQLLGRSALRILHAAFFWGGLVDLIGANPVEVVLIPAVLAVGTLSGIVAVVLGDEGEDDAGEATYHRRSFQV